MNIDHTAIRIIDGRIQSNNVAAFDFDGTLARSDSGLIFMRTVIDWVTTINYDKMVLFMSKLADDNWTIVFFTNQLERNREFTQGAIGRIGNFINSISRHNPRFSPYVYISLKEDNYRKPNRGMWDLFINQTGINPSAASFYCGDAIGPESQNPLYKWGTFDKDFANNIGLALYTPDEILGIYSPPEYAGNIFLIMAAHESQWQNYINNLLNEYPHMVITNLESAGRELKNGRLPIVIGERFATIAGRRRAFHILPKDAQPVFLMFTQPIKPFITDNAYLLIDKQIRGYANALDYHQSYSYMGNNPVFEEPYPIIRIN